MRRECWLGWVVARARSAGSGGAGPGDSADERERVDLRGELPADAVQLIQGAGVEVVGESQYRGAIEAVVGRRTAGHKTIVDAALVWEPENRHDPNAIAIKIVGRTCGYLGRADAVRYRPVMEAYRARGQVPYVRGDVRGGWRQDDGSWAHFGITLYVANPDKLLERLGGA